MVSEKDNNISDIITQNTDLNGQNEQLRYNMVKLTNEVDSEKNKNQNFQTQINIQCSQYNNKIQELHQKLNQSNCQTQANQANNATFPMTNTSNSNNTNSNSNSNSFKPSFTIKPGGSMQASNLGNNFPNSYNN